MTSCDRCHKVANTSSVGVPENRWDLCARCFKDLLDTLGAFIRAASFSVRSVTVDRLPDPAPIESNVTES